MGAPPRDRHTPVASRASTRTSRTRLALLEAGQRLFSTKPVDAITIDDIVQAAGVGKGTFYNHFPDRDGLLLTIARDIRTLVEQAVVVANAGIDDPAMRVARASCSYIHFVLADPVRAGVLIRIHNDTLTIDAPLNGNAIADVSSGLRSGRFRIATLETGVLFVMGVTKIALVHVAQRPSVDVAVNVAQQMLTMTLAGLGIDRTEASAIAARASEEIIRLAASPIVIEG